LIAQSQNGRAIVNEIRRVLVIGGGVGGLTAAATLARRGVETILIERRAAFAVPGVGLGQPANALRVYDSLGVLEEILETGFICDRMHIFDPSRQLIAEHKFLLGDDSVPAFCALSRLQLHKILLGAAERAGVQVRLGVTVSKILEEQDRATVHFSTGQSETFDLLAGFDGIRSSTRQHLVGTAFVPRPSGYGAWRVQVPRPDYVRGMEFLQGVGSKTGAMPLNDHLMYLFHIRPEAVDASFAQQDYGDYMSGGTVKPDFCGLFLPCFLAFRLSFVRPRRRLSSAPTVDFGRRRAQKLSRSAVAPP
jgi:2-polyprenyl-6-methoxyphenol hydroxylase-like FAD-dependent oxidoreductase